MAPDEQSLRADLTSARFLSGEDRGRWQFRQLAVLLACGLVAAWKAIARRNLTRGQIAMTSRLAELSN